MRANGFADPRWLALSGINFCLSSRGARGRRGGKMCSRDPYLAIYCWGESKADHFRRWLIEKMRRGNARCKRQIATETKSQTTAATAGVKRPPHGASNQT